MYIPNTFLQSDEKQIIKFIERFSFGTLITAKNNFPSATHLPFLVSKNPKGIILKSHFAKANGQYEDIENNDILVIFTEPHAYISPKIYNKEQNVPTWNYISVHAYGQGKIIYDATKISELLESTIETYESSYKKQWNQLPKNYKSKMTNGIVAFEILVSEFQAKQKLSQNKKENERTKIINLLSNSNKTNEKLIADYMKMQLEKEKE